MSEQRFHHTDNDGDSLEVTAGMYGSIIWAKHGNEEVGVAVRYADLPGLISALQGILSEADR